jgi:hypothetical protein
VATIFRKNSFVTSSTSIEEIHLSKEELEILRNEATPAFKYVYGKSSGSRRERSYP